MIAKRVAHAAILVVLGGLSASPLPAQEETTAAPPPFPDFTFRRVTPPAPGQDGPRITVQIGDRAQDAPDPEGQPAPAPRRQTADWFWSAIAEGIDAGAGRYRAAMDLLATAPEAGALPIMRAAGLQALAEAHGAQLLRETIGTRVSPALALAVMAVESRGDAAARSQAGARGLMQLIPATATRFGVEDAFDAGQNISGGIAYLDWLMAEFERDPILVLAAYNAGEGAVRAAGGVPDYAETRAYVPRVLATWAAARLLCVTPPELISDGCVFRSMMGQ
ncbi:lytic transglycosylase domain-containing protein [Rhodobacteraceae bacterium W635]|uniref:lytic transglycosylase domain-containing protein n=1 Tax=Nioella halotolerans TaxID=2303578 RepID=UPI000E3BAE98|nr:lytic transglycosylase domain-containing protein [Rhodobacteraceae bacterium W635]